MCCNITHGWLTVSKNSISKANCFLKFCLSETSKEATIVNFTFRNGPEFSAQTIMRKAGLTNNRFILAFENKKSNLNLKIWFSAFIRILLFFFVFASQSTPRRVIDTDNFIIFPTRLAVKLLFDYK